jgi:hypothetical protein
MDGDEIRLIRFSVLLFLLDRGEVRSRRCRRRTPSRNRRRQFTHPLLVSLLVLLCPADASLPGEFYPTSIFFRSLTWLLDLRLALTDDIVSQLLSLALRYIA